MNSEKPSYQALELEIAALRKEKTQILRENNERWKMLLKGTANVAVQGYDKNGQTIYWNKASEMFYGYTAQEAIGQNITDLIIPDELKSIVKRDIQEMFKTKIPIPAEELTLKRKDGSTINVFSSHSYVEVPGSEPEMFCLDVDITEHKQAEERLTLAKEKAEENERKLNEAQKLAHIGSWYYDPFKNESIWTEETYNIWGLDPKISPVKYSDHKQLIHPDDWQHFEDTVKEALEKGISYNIEIRIISPNRPEKVVNTIGAPLFDDNHKLIAIRGTTQDITARKNAEEALKESDEKIRYILKHNPNAIAVFNNNMDILLVSDRFKKDYHKEHEDLIGRNHYDVFPEIPERWRKIHQRVLKGEILSNEDDYFERQDGSITYSKWECRPWFQSNGSIGGLIAYTEVTTERKLAEIALKESQEKLMSIFDNMADVLWSVSFPDFQPIFVSKSAIDLYGYSHEQFLNDPKLWLNVIHPKDQPSAQNVYAVLKKTGKSTRECRVISSDGKVKYILDRSWLLYENDKPVRVDGITRDITEQKKAEFALKESEESFREMFKNMGDGVCRYKVVDKGNDFIFADINKAGEKIAKVKKAEVLGKSIFEFRPNSKKYGLTDVFKKVWETGKTETYNESFYQDEDLSGYYKNYVYKLSSGDIVAIFEDLTESKKSEEIIIKSEQKLRDLNATKDKLFSIISHDLRSPFNSILGLSNLLAQSLEMSKLEEAKNYSKLLNHSGKTALALVDNLLNWAKAQTGQLKFDPTILSLKPIVVEVFNTLKPTADLKNISLKYYDNVQTDIFADEDMLKTILRNLISNGIKFTHTDGEIVVYAERKPKTIEITVSDNGVGITKDIRDKLFQINKAVTTGGTANEKGSGLGLIICREFVQKHGGQIWLESEIQKGSAFKFSLPTR